MAADGATHSHYYTLGGQQFVEDCKIISIDEGNSLIHSSLVLRIAQVVSLVYAAVSATLLVKEIRAGRISQVLSNQMEALATLASLCTPVWLFFYRIRSAKFAAFKEAFLAPLSAPKSGLYSIDSGEKIRFYDLLSHNKISGYWDNEDSKRFLFTTRYLQGEEGDRNGLFFCYLDPTTNTTHLLFFNFNGKFDRAVNGLELTRAEIDPLPLEPTTHVADLCNSSGMDSIDNEDLQKLFNRLDTYQLAKIHKDRDL